MSWIFAEVLNPFLILSSVESWNFATASIPLVKKVSVVANAKLLAVASVSFALSIVYSFKFINFGREHIKDDDVFHIVNSLFDVAPKVLTEQGKAKNPWPNVDAASGSLLYHYGLKEFNFYTVLFSISRSMGMIAQMVWERALGIPITRPKSVTTDWIKENS